MSLKFARMNTRKMHILKKLNNLKMPYTFYNTVLVITTFQTSQMAGAQKTKANVVFAIKACYIFYGKNSCNYLKTMFYHNLVF